MQQDLKNILARSVQTLVLLLAVCAWCAGCNNQPATLETLSGEDGSVWERVSEPGFGNKDNTGVVKMCVFQNSLYAVTRNDVTGFELWRTSGDSWERVQVPGFTDGLFQELKYNVWSCMMEFQGSLYVGVSSGYQGSKLFRSVGMEIWRYDGTNWEAVVSHTLGDQVTGTIASITGCANKDDDSTASFGAGAAGWTENQWQGGLLWITSGAGKGRVFNIVSNTQDSLIVQQNENAALQAGEVEYTRCDEQKITTDYPMPPYTIGAVAAGDSFKILKGATANGFGEMWNKGAMDFTVLNDELFLSIGFNYLKGARVWKTADGKTWTPMTDYSMGMRQGYDPEGNPTDFCLIDGTQSRNGQPVSSSFTKFGQFEVDGKTMLFMGGTGTSGCNGRAARCYRYDGTAWEPIVDYFVDANATGTNENGFGDDGGASGFMHSNFQAWSWANYRDCLFVGIFRMVGGRIMYTTKGTADDDAWLYAMGGDAATPDAFSYSPNMGANLYTFNEKLYAGTVDEEIFATTDNPDAVIAEERGADIWAGSGEADNIQWQRITRDAFGDNSIIQFDAFTEFNGKMYVAGSNANMSTVHGGEREGALGVKIYRLAK